MRKLGYIGPMFLTRISRIARRIKVSVNRGSTPSFSDCGEDLIIEKILQMLEIRKYNYLDIGSNHPIWGNDFFLSYTKGMRGINIEPNPDFSKSYLKYRHEDLNIAALVSIDEDGFKDFFINPNHLISSSDLREGRKINVKMMEARGLVALVKDSENCVLKINVEGSDFEILEELINWKFRPIIIQVETFSGINNDYLNSRESNFDNLLQADYALVAMTPLNSIYVRKTDWVSKFAARAR